MSKINYLSELFKSTQEDAVYVSKTILLVHCGPGDHRVRHLCSRGSLCLISEYPLVKDSLNTFFSLRMRRNKPFNSP